MKAEEVKSSEDFLKDAHGTVKFMSCDEYKYALKREVDHVLIDVRTKSEFDEGHIKEAIHIARGSIEFEIAKVVQNKNTPIMLCCGTGKRSALAALTLHEMGYSNVRVLDGGYNEYCKIDG